MSDAGNGGVGLTGMLCARAPENVIQMAARKTKPAKDFIEPSLKA